MVIARKENQEVMIPLESYEVYFKNTGWTMVKDLAKEDGKQERNEKPEMVEEEQPIVEDKENNREFNKDRSNRNNKRK